MDDFDRTAFYARYDKAVAALPSEYRSKASHRNCGEDRHGIHFFDEWGQKFAIVDSEGRVRLPLNSSEQPKPASEYVTKGDLDAFVSGVIRRTNIRASKDLKTRIENLEAVAADMLETGLRCKGFWRDGTKAIRGDAFTHDGSFWRALRDTDERPSAESPDWMLVARKGRDAR